MTSTKLQPARGTRDLLPEDNRAFRLIDETAWHNAQLYGFEELNTPIFEFTNVFQKTLGETSDIVGKEMYTFKDRGDESLTLRPEGTAGIARAFISEGMAQNLPLKFYYVGPMFRYERPQKGRYRQFHQVGIESLGLETPQADIEVLLLGQRILESLKIANIDPTKSKCQLELNTIGDTESRLAYKNTLVEYLKDYESSLSADSKLRLEKNPMRILDSKDEGDKKIIAGAPKMAASLNQASLDFFGTITSTLEKLKIPYTRNENLVRGLDYYCHTVFEFTSTHLGAQSAILAGGRYDGLIEMMGGPKVPGVGWAFGMERIALLLEAEMIQKTQKTVAIICADESAFTKCTELAEQVRTAGYTVEQPTSGNVGKKFKRADKVGATYAIIIGSTELEKNKANVKNLKTGEQKEVPFGQDLLAALVF